MSEDNQDAALRGDPDADEAFAFGPFRFYPDGGLLYRNDTETALAPRALGVLECLLDRPGRVVSKQELMDRVWGDTAVTEHSLTEAVRTLRLALGDDPRQPTYIQTVYRRGFRFVAPVSRDDDGLASMATSLANGTLGNAAAVVAEKAASSSADMVDGQIAAPQLAPRGALPWSLLGVAVVSLAVVFLMPPFWSGGALDVGEASTLPAVPFTVTAPTGAEVLVGETPQISMLPDGSGVVFPAVGASGGMWYMRSFDALETLPLPGTEPLSYGVRPFFSPDGRRMGFFAGVDIEARSTRDGSMETLCSRCTGRIGFRSSAGATWSPDGTIVFANGELRRLSPTGEVEIIPAPGFDHPRGVYMWPSFLPGYEWVLATARSTGAIRGAAIVAVHIHSGETKQLLEDGTNPRYVPTGHLLFARGGNLMAVPFDLDRLEVRGSPAVVVEGVMMSALLGAAQYSVSDNGTLAYQPGETIRREFPIVSADHEGNLQPLIEERRDFREVRFSPDGKQLAVTVADGPYRHIWVYYLDIGEGYQITSGSTDNEGPVWDPRGKRLAFVSMEDGTQTLNVVRADGWNFPNDSTEVMSSDDPIYAPSWSADGRTIAYQTWKNEGWDIWVVDVADPEPRPFLESESDDMAPEFSPDGRWLAYSSDSSIYVTEYPGRERTFEVSAGNRGNDIRWAADGRELYFRGAGLWVVPVEDGPDPEFGVPRRLPIRGYLNFFDVSPDGQQIVRVDRRLSPVMSTGFNVVLNWFTELERLVPTGR